MNIELELNRTINMLMAHPDNEPNSEFADRIDSLIDLKQQFSLQGVSHQRELLKAFCDWAFKQDDAWSISDIDIENYLKSL
jgi:hypothetical protein